ncbi:DUF418 domain-containing protein [Sphingomonas aliaeris]|uniref:DUF418 domain-containing protein n=1 Tax=Sphingomonas aliaeris TaxID=2759526 RepID=A0A974S301_9SPHN|nr:DUF418 domain-containing protein [Sphingomonas aliaeris]QQV76077.1 DUF418 domain-containing protein [Sphingomonas aliaeris]
MADVTMTTAMEPDGAPRLAGLDILRGVAILGILFMNINDMGGSLWASFDDPRHLGWSQADQVAWWLRDVLASGTARCLLEMLFGVGMVILTDRAANALRASADEADSPGGMLRFLFGDWAVMRGYYARNLVLWLFGLIHLFILLWPGDILHTYGIAALIALLFRRLGPKTLLGLGMLMALAQLFGAGFNLHQAQTRLAQVEQLQGRIAHKQKLTKDEAKQVAKTVERKKERAKDKAETAKRVAREDKARGSDTATFATWADSAWTSTLFIWGVNDGIGDGMMLEPLFIWEAFSSMLIGAALFKWGVIQGRRSRAFYRNTMVVAYAIGLSGRAYIAFVVMRFDDYPYLIYAVGEVARLATTLGHISAVYLLLGTAWGVKLLKPFEAAGRTALTIYIAQTIICLWVLYPPWALGLYGQQGWMALMLTAVAVNAVLLVWANWYVRHYAIAPVEWAWRSLIARRLLPIGKRSKAGDNREAGVIPAA